MSVNIQLEWTPNPSTLKYVVDRTLVPRGALNFTTAEAASARSPLASKLMGIQGVSGVMLGSNFVTVTKGEAGEWDTLNDAVMATLDAHLGADEPVVAPGALEGQLLPSHLVILVAPEGLGLPSHPAAPAVPESPVRLSRPGDRADPAHPLAQQGLVRL